MPHDHDIDYLLGAFPADLQPRKPFADEVVAFLADLAAALRSHRVARTMPDLVAAAFWCRRGHLKRLHARFEDGQHRLGRGLVFHVAPSNVPVNFLYSFAFGLLAGCANIVRVPSRDTPSLTLLLEILQDLLGSQDHIEIAQSNCFVRYERGHAATSRFSEQCDARVIWGGDATIADIRQYPIPARATDITFPDRYSLALLSEEAVLNATPDQLERLAQGFYNDAFLMDQQACSSPHMVLWTNQAPGGKDRFWRAVSRHVRNQYALEPVQAVDRHEKLMGNFLAQDGQRLVSDIDGAPLLRVQLETVPQNPTDLRGINGLFYEAALAKLTEMAPVITRKYQTLAYYGLEKSELSDFVIKGRLCGIDRIVPVGTALDIDTIWDGTDVLKSLSRIIDVR